MPFLIWLISSQTFLNTIVGLSIIGKVVPGPFLRQSAAKPVHLDPYQG